MEPPNSWSLLEGSLAVCELDNPAFAWAFLVVQGLVRDLPDDRETFYHIVKEEIENPVTGPSSYRRIGFRMRDAGILLSASQFPDPNAELAQQRLQQINGWLKAMPVKFAAGHGVFCVYCGFDVGDTPNGMPCPNCASPIPDPSATRGKPCPRCKEPNLLFASFCEFCSSRLVVVHCYQCGSEVQPQAIFCPTCGLRIAATEMEAAESETAIMPTPEPMPQKINGEDNIKSERYETQLHTPGTRKVNEKVTEPVSEPPKKHLHESRIFTIYNQSTDPEQLAKKAADLLAIVTSAIQDMVVMQEIMQEKGIWDAERYKELRTQRMISDHSSGGAAPWLGYSIYPYTLEETEFLRQKFNADEEEVQKFEKQVEHIQMLS
jgi:hypothetical protein